jgi:MFS superfamily sulfate permease-like transporter
MLSIIGLVIVIVATYYTYKTAKDYGRNAVLWAIATFCVGFGVQFVVPIVIGFVLAIIWVIQGSTDPLEMQARLVGPAAVIGLICLVASLVGMWMILKKVSQVPDEPVGTTPPPPPTDFN